MSASWLTHLEHQWRSLAWKPWLQYFSSKHTLVRYDSRGCGLSDRDVRDVSFEIWMRDFEAVADAAEFDRYCVLGTCQGGPVAMEYAARHPDRVSQLLLYATYTRGLARRPGRSSAVRQGQVLLDMLQLGWGDDSHAYLQVWASLFQPGGSLEHLRSWSEQQRLSTSAEMAAKLFQTTFDVDVQQSARRVKCPALVVGLEHDTLVPLEESRLVASLIPGARFVALNTNNHMLLQEEPAWPRLISEFEAFLKEPAATEAGDPRERFAGLTSRERQVLEAIARGLDNAEIASHLHLSEKTVRNHITRLLDKIGVEHRYQAIVIARDAGFGQPRKTAV